MQHLGELADLFAHHGAGQQEALAHLLRLCSEYAALLVQRDGEEGPELQLARMDVLQQRTVRVAGRIGKRSQTVRRRGKIRCDDRLRHFYRIS